MEKTTETSETHVTETVSTDAAATSSANRNAALNSLAIVGFIALVLIGITIAIYSARYVPAAVSKLASATIATTSPATLAVVSPEPTGTTLPFTEVANTTTIGAVHTPPTDGSQEAAIDSAPAVAPITSSASKKPTLYDLPDLSTTIVATGYLANGSNSSFVPAQVIPAGARAAVQFTIANDGTNSTGPWGFIAELPTANGYVFTSPVEENLNPGDHILFTLGFDQASPQPGPQTATIVADPNNQINEISKGNNTASAAFTIAY